MRAVLRRLAAVLVSLCVVALVAAPAPAEAATGDVGFQGPTYTGMSLPPTSDKPQSKLWWNDGSWWADMWFNTSWHIARWDRATDTWIDTGIANDTRSSALADVLWDGTHLFIASHSVTVSSDATPVASVAGRATQLYRYSYAGGKYTLDAGFPTQVNNNSSESLTIDEDSNGVIWATWTQVSKDAVGNFTNTVYMNNSAPGGTSWGSPFVLPVDNPHPDVDDISAVVAFNKNKIGVMWSDQLLGTVWWAVRTDGTAPTATSSWRQTIASKGTGFADDHLNLKSLQSDTAGRVFAAVKTSLNDVSTVKTNDQLQLLVFKPGTGAFTKSTIGTVADCVTRPQVVLDSEHQLVHVFDTAPGPSVAGCAFSGVSGAIYDKTASMDNPVFSSGKGTLVMQDAASQNLNDVTSTKQGVTGATGLVVLASNTTAKRYWSADLSLGGTTPAPAPAPAASFTATPTTGDAPLAVQFTDTSTGSPTSWSWDFGDGSTAATTQNPSHTYATAGTFTATLTATNASGSATATKTITVTTPAPAPAPGQISFHGASKGANVTETTLVLPSAPGTVAGDVLVATVSVRGAPTITAPSGWTLIKDQVNGTTARTATYWRTATASEPASHTFTFSKAQAATGTVLAYAGVSTTNPVDAVAASANATTSTALTAPAVTTTTGGDLLVGVFTTSNGTTITPPAGTTERADVNTGATSFKATVENADTTQATAGATGTLTATAASGSTAITQLIALRPGA